MNMDNIFLLPWWLSPKLPCKMFNTLSWQCFDTGELFPPGPSEGWPGSKAVCPRENGGSQWSCWIAPNPDLVPELVFKLKNLTAGLELYQKVAHSWCLLLAPLYDVSPRETPSAPLTTGPKADATSSYQGKWKGHRSCSAAQSHGTWDSGILFIIRASFASQLL